MLFFSVGQVFPTSRVSTKGGECLENFPADEAMAGFVVVTKAAERESFCRIALGFKRRLSVDQRHIQPAD